MRDRTAQRGLAHTAGNSLLEVRGGRVRTLGVAGAGILISCWCLVFFLLQLVGVSSFTGSWRRLARACLLRGALSWGHWAQSSWKRHPGDRGMWIPCPTRPFEKSKRQREGLSRGSWLDAQITQFLLATLMVGEFTPLLRFCRNVWGLLLEADTHENVGVVHG